MFKWNVSFSETFGLLHFRSVAAEILSVWNSAFKVSRWVNISSLNSTGSSDPERSTASTASRSFILEKKGLVHQRGTELRHQSKFRIVDVTGIYRRTNEADNRSSRARFIIANSDTSARFGVIRSRSSGWLFKYTVWLMLSADFLLFPLVETIHCSLHAYRAADSHARPTRPSHATKWPSADLKIHSKGTSLNSRVLLCFELQRTVDRVDWSGAWMFIYSNSFMRRPLELFECRNEILFNRSITLAQWKPLGRSDSLSGCLASKNRRLK